MFPEMSSLDEYRRLVDETLQFGSLSDVRLLKEYIRNYLEGDDGGVQHLDVDAAIERRTAEMWEFLEDLRCLSVEKTSHLKFSHQDSTDTTPSNDREWKLKDDTGTYRVLYRRGAEGTPFHVICLEGVIEGPAVMALCIAWEAPKFKEWWPSFSVPPFKIMDAKWLKRVRPGHDVATFKFKVPWPFSTRDAAISAFALNVPERGTIIAVMNSVPARPDDIHEAEEGYGANDVPPPSSNVVRMDVKGGYVLQQIDKNRCYFRTISSIDMKVDVVPPSVINFLSRQLAGNGFILFQEAVNEAVQNKKGIGSIFQKLVATEPLYRRVSASIEAYLRLQEARKLIAAGKQADLNFQTEVTSTERRQTEDGVKHANTEAISGVYEGLEERDPEIFHAVQAIDRIISLLKAKRAIFVQTQSGSTSRSNSRREFVNEKVKSMEVGNAGNEILGSSMVSRTEVKASESLVNRIPDPLPNKGSGIRQQTSLASEKNNNLSNLHGETGNSYPIRVLNSSDKNFSASSERLENLRAMSGAGKKLSTFAAMSGKWKEAGSSEPSFEVPTDAKSMPEENHPPILSSARSGNESGFNSLSEEKLKRNGSASSTLVAVTKKKRLLGKLWKKRFSNVKRSENALD